MFNKVKNSKFILIILIFFVINILFITKSNAFGDMSGKSKNFLESGNAVSTTLNLSALQDTSEFIYNIFLAAGIVVAVIVAMIIGIKFMMASAGDKAKVKEALIPFVIGCAVVFGSFTIWKVVVDLGNNAEDSSASAVSPIPIAFQTFEEYMDDTGLYWSDAAQAIADRSITGLNSEELSELKGLAQSALNYANMSYSQSPELAALKADLNELLTLIDSQ